MPVTYRQSDNVVYGCMVQSIEISTCSISEVGVTQAILRL